MIDLRSDTLTRPTEAMQQAMTQAASSPALGDETLFGDPLVKQLEEKAATLTGKEDAVFVASGSMGNLSALFAHKKGGTEVVIDYLSHIARMEFGGASVAAGLYPIRIHSQQGEMDLEELEGALAQAHARQHMAPAAVCLESTHNHSGGYVPTLAHMREVRALAHKAGSPVHLDGARIFNAATALGLPVGDIAAMGDSVSFCLSKGLSAPFGAVLAGSKEIIDRARVFRRMLGGGMRQIGIMAAAGLVALETMPQHLAEDHRRAKNLWEGIRTIDPAIVDDQAPQSNILFLRIRNGSALEWTELCKTMGVFVQGMTPGKIRIVTHRHITDACVTTALTALAAAHARYNA